MEETSVFGSRTSLQVIWDNQHLTGEPKATCIAEVTTSLWLGHLSSDMVTIPFKISNGVLKGIKLRSSIDEHIIVLPGQHGLILVTQLSSPDMPISKMESKQ